MSFNHNGRSGPSSRSEQSFFCWSNRTVVLAATAFFAFLSLPMAQATAQINQSSPIGTNLIEVTYYTAEQPFLNILKTGSMWAGTLTGGTRYDQTQNVFQLDSNGYPTSMNGTGPAAGQNFSEIDTLVLRDLGPSLYPAGNYVFLYDGTGSFSFQFDASNSNIVSSVPGRIVINVPAPSVAGIKIFLTSTGAGGKLCEKFSISV